MRVLFVVHGFPPESSAGTEVYARDLALALQRAGDTVEVLAREANPGVPELSLRTEVREGLTVHLVNNTWREVRGFEDGYRNPRLLEAVRPTLEAFAPDVAHVHHLTGLSTELLPALRALGVPVLFTAHDFWMLCHRGQLIDVDGRRCAGPTPAGCARCLGATAAPPGLRGAARVGRAVAARVPEAAGLLRAAARLAGKLGPAEGTEPAELRLAHGREVLGAASLVHAPSRTVATALRAFGVPQERLELGPLGIDLRPFGTSAPAPRAGGPLRLGFLGTLMLSKAPHLLLEAHAALRPGVATVELVGPMAAYHGDDRYRERLAPLLERPGVTWRGALPHHEVLRWLQGIDVLVTPSTWLENSPLSIREAFAAGVPVVTAAQGGMAESVEDGVDGLHFRPDDAADLARVLGRLLDEPGLLSALRRGVRPPRSLEDDARATRERYARLVAGADPGRARVAAIVLNHRTFAATLDAVASLERSRPRPDEIIVVDNGSGDGSAGFLAATLEGRATCVALPRNVGFPAGMNVGIARALAGGAAQVLLVNSDAQLRPDCLGVLQRALRERPRAGVVAPVLVSGGAAPVVESVGCRVDLTTGRMRHEGFGVPLAQLAPARLRAVDAVSGCVVLLRRAMLEAVGPFTEDYFFSFEDLDLCLRARRAGWEVLVAGDAVVEHQRSHSIGLDSPRRVYFATRNHLLLAARAAPLPAVRAGFRAAAIAALNLAHVVVRSPTAHLSGGVAAWGQGVWDYARGRSGSDAGEDDA